MTTTKFEIQKNSIEVPYSKRKQIEQGCTVLAIDTNPVTIACYDTLEDARRAFGKYETEITYYSGSARSYYLVEETYIIECIYDEDGDFVETADVYDVTELPIHLGDSYCNRKTWDAIASYMDDEKREQVHAELAPCSEQKFLDRYLELDPDFADLLWDEFRI